MKPIFIDRDGVINRDPGGWTEHSYITKWDDFYFLPGAKGALKKLTDKGFTIVVISNQAGVAKGYYSRRALSAINSKMLKEIRLAGGRIKKVYYCVHQDSDNCGCRKPKAGLIRRAEEELRFKAAGSYLIGDGRMDVEAGKRAFLKTILVLSGKTKREEAGSWKVKPDFVFEDLPEAVNFILSRAKNYRSG